MKQRITAQKPGLSVHQTSLECYWNRLLTSDSYVRILIKRAKETNLLVGGGFIFWELELDWPLGLEVFARYKRVQKFDRFHKSSQKEQLNRLFQEDCCY